MTDAHESPASTIPDTPTWDYDPEGAKGDFARLTPLSPLARTAFNDVVHRIHTQPDSLRHARRFIHYAPLHADEGGENSQDGSPVNSIARNKYCGYYRLNLGILPKNIGLGWVAGSSRRNLRDDDVDLMLTPQPGQHDVRGRHVRFSHNTNTGVLMVFADNWEVIIDGKKRIQNTAFAACENTGLMLGDLSYTIEFTDLDPQMYKTRLDDMYRQRQNNFSGIPHFLSPTPTPSLRASGYDKYFIYPTSAGGSYSTVSRACKKDTGELFVLKKMKRNNHNLAEIRKEVEILKSLDHCFAGLAYVHQQGLMHRDIKLDNIGLVNNNNSGQPLRVVLLDFGHATRNPTSTNHMKGTIRYLAPEVIALKRTVASHTNPYTNKVDTWALGICIYELFHESFIRWKCVDDGAADEGWIRQEIASILSEDEDRYMIRLAMRSTIVWNPLVRCSAGDGLALLGGERVEGEGKEKVAVTAAKRRQVE
ncbi:hypothetical protein LTR16_001375 [Cryomyces antarcticus]|uniref:Protein kinase domain-containing protein n=1 Tax=Cryomyces antarcticus TaxID=329879 RepID=A0ABR0LQB3_9PEZI|nr:hypothetical protein LTR16_001375 [Cryomyces antarcticus]